MTVQSGQAVSFQLVANPAGFDGIVVGDYNGATVFSGSASGTFSGVRPTGVTNFGNGASVADLNRDGLPDLVSTGPAGVSVYLGLAGGGFGTGFDFPVGSPGAPHVLDLDGNGTPDVYLANVNGVSAWFTSCWH